MTEGLGLARLLFKHVGCEARILLKKFGCEARLLFKHFRCKARLLFNHYGCEARLLFKCLWCKARLLFKHLMVMPRCASDDRGATPVHTSLPFLAVQAMCYSILAGQLLTEWQHRPKAVTKKRATKCFFFSGHTSFQWCFIMKWVNKPFPAQVDTRHIPNPIQPSWSNTVPM